MTDPTPLLSQRLGPIDSRVKDFVRDYSKLWLESPAEPLPMVKSYARTDKKEIERDLTALVEKVTAEQKNLPDEAGEQNPDWIDRFADALQPFLKRLLDRLDIPLKNVFDKRYLDATHAFIQASRRFDPELAIAQVYQALRNVWIMNSLQFYLETEVGHTDAVFGYSMVYPYLDNLLDDDTIEKSRKLQLMMKLKAWLEGESDLPNSPQELKLYSLIKMVESQFPRSGYPGVFQSMLSIFNGQVKSLLQQQEGKGAPDEAAILAISMEKGGTSVLADGYLVAGRLTREQEDFCFGFGAFLQLADDLQDIDEDARRGHMTLFSRLAGRRKLDPQVYKLYWFMNRILERTLDAGRPREQDLQDVIQRSCALMYLEAVGKNPSHFSRSCVRNSQKAFPVRYSYLAKLRRTIQERFVTGREKISDLDPVSTALLTLSSRALSLD
jgi:hypothetical protein